MRQQHVSWLEQQQQMVMLMMERWWGWGGRECSVLSGRDKGGGVGSYQLQVQVEESFVRLTDFNTDFTASSCRRWSGADSGVTPKRP